MLFFYFIFFACTFWVRRFLFIHLGHLDYHHVCFVWFMKHKLWGFNSLVWVHLKNSYIWNDMIVSKFMRGFSFWIWSIPLRLGYTTWLLKSTLHITHLTICEWLQRKTDHHTLNDRLSHTTRFSSYFKHQQTRSETRIARRRLTNENNIVLKSAQIIILLDILWC